MKIQVMAFMLAAIVIVKAQPLSVGITYDPPGGFFLDVFNMQVGQTYGIGAKNMPSADPFDVWSLINVFDAEAPAMRFEGTATSSQRNFIAASLNDYVGPSVSIVSPAPGSVVSGDVPVRVAVSDILPLLTVEIFVGETLAGVILPGQDGAMNLPSYWFPNGEQEIWARVVNEGLDVDTDGNGLADSSTTFAGWGSVSVTFSNEVYMENFSPLYSAYGLSYFATIPHDYTFEVYRLNGESLHIQTGTINGTLFPPWNFTDLVGNPVDDNGYVFSLTATPAGEGLGALFLASSPALESAARPTTKENVPIKPHEHQFQNFSHGELLLVQSGISLPAPTTPSMHLTEENLLEILRKIAARKPGVPPPLPPISSSSPKLPPGYPAATISGASGPAAAQAKVIKTTNFFDKGVTVRKYVISYGEWPYQPYNEWYEDMNDAVSSRVNVAAFYDPDIIGENRETHSTVHADFTADPYAIKAATQTNHLAVLTNALADASTGSWLFEGHSGPDDLITGQDGYLTVKLWASDLAALLGNKISPSWALATNLTYTRRLFSTFMTGCSAVNGGWPLATGTPHGVKQEGNPFIKKSAFLGFTGISRVDTDGTKVRWINDIHNIWIDWQVYDTPLKTGVDLGNFHFPAVVPWGPTLLGYRFLHYDGEGSW